MELIFNYSIFGKFIFFISVFGFLVLFESYLKPPACAYEFHFSYTRTFIVAIASTAAVIFISTIISWLLFKLIPAPVDAPNVVTVFTGVFGVIAGSIGFYRIHERKRKRRQSRLNVEGSEGEEEENWV